MTSIADEKLLVITDLDASLLDEDYGYDGAKEALAALKEKGFPLILNSSKTYAELRQLAEKLGQCDAVVAENGGLVAIHQLSSIAPVSEADANGFILQPAGMARREILEVAHALRESHSYSFEGFSDWSVQQVIDHTGLSVSAAALAMERETTEPIIWNGTELEWNSFYTSLQEAGIKALRGGRFIHLMGQVDKALGMQQLVDRYKQAEPHTLWKVVAIGDSANDKAMIEAADYGVVIPHTDGPRVHPEQETLIIASKTGSKGWGEAVSNILKNYK